MSTPDLLTACGTTKYKKAARYATVGTMRDKVTDFGGRMLIFLTVRGTEKVGDAAPASAGDIVPRVEPADAVVASARDRQRH